MKRNENTSARQYDGPEIEDTLANSSPQFNPQAAASNVEGNVRDSKAASSAPAPLNETSSSLSESRRRELADFLRTRREKLKPEQMGLAQSTRRRTPGLRREEVAELAGVGTTWYTWLEQARDIQPSAEVLRRLGGALRLTPAELKHMFALAGKASPTDLDTDADHVSESLLRFFESGLQVPAVLVGSRWDILAVNKQASEAFDGIAKLPENRRNWIYYVLASHDGKTRTAEWEMHARRLLAEFRSSLSDSLDHPWVVELINALRADSPDFETWWREHDVRDNTAIQMTVHHPVKGEMKMERTVLLPWENSRLKILLFTPNN